MKCLEVKFWLRVNDRIIFGSLIYGVTVHGHWKNNITCLKLGFNVGVAFVFIRIFYKNF